MNDLDRLVQLVNARTSVLGLYARQWVDATAAEDVVQDALASLLAQRPVPSDPLRWMYRAVRNAAIDHARAATRRRRRERTIAREHQEWFETLVPSPLDTRAAELALRQLPMHQREIVVLRIWGELSFRQIAQTLQLSVSTAHERYAMAVQQLRNALEKPCPQNLK